MLSLRTCVSNLLHSRLAVGTILNGKWGDLLCVLGVVCSTWVAVNKGTSRRSEVLPMGDPSRPSVRESNLMVSRTGLPASLSATHASPLALLPGRNSMCQGCPDPIAHPDGRWSLAG